MQWALLSVFTCNPQLIRQVFWEATEPRQQCLKIVRCRAGVIVCAGCKGRVVIVAEPYARWRLNEELQQTDELHITSLGKKMQQGYGTNLVAEVIERVLIYLQLSPTRHAPQRTTLRKCSL